MASDDDLRLLEGEARRALARLRAIRERLDDLRSNQRISPEAYDEVYPLTRETQG